MAVAAVVNGGKLISRPSSAPAARPTRPRGGSSGRKPASCCATSCVSTPDRHRKKANVAGYFVGGKTGTAEKVIGGHYSKNKLFTTFMALVPADKPQYLFLTVKDEPQGLPETAITPPPPIIPASSPAADRARRPDPRTGAARRGARRIRSPCWRRPPRDRNLPANLSAGGALIRLAPLLPEHAACSAALESGVTADSRAVEPGLHVLRRRRARWPTACASCRRPSPRGAVASSPNAASPARRRARRRGRRRTRPRCRCAAARFYPRQPETVVAVTGT